METKVVGLIKKGIRCLSVIIGIVVCSLGFISCEDDPSFPPKGFSIVGSWSYNTRPLELFPGEDTVPYIIYDQPAVITFDANGEFSFTINNGDEVVCGYGTYEYDEDGGVYLIYSYAKVLEEMNINGYASDAFTNSINWGSDYTVVEEDYIKTENGSLDWIEYRRIPTVPLHHTIGVHKYQNKSGASPSYGINLMYHDGQSAVGWNKNGVLEK